MIVRIKQVTAFSICLTLLNLVTNGCQSPTPVSSSAQEVIQVSNQSPQQKQMPELLLTIIQNGKMGYINQKGKIAIKPEG